MNNNSYEMATPVNALQGPRQPPNPNVNNLIRNIENNIENISNVKNVQSTQPASVNFQQQRMIPPELVYNPNPVFKNEVEKKPVEVQPKKEVVNKPVKKAWHKRILINSKEYLIMILLFSLLAHKKVNKLLMFYIPYIGNFQSPLPSLIFRGLIFAVILFVIKHVI